MKIVKCPYCGVKNDDRMIWCRNCDKELPDNLEEVNEKKIVINEKLLLDVKANYGLLILEYANNIYNSLSINATSFTSYSESIWSFKTRTIKGVVETTDETNNLIQQYLNDFYNEIKDEFPNETEEDLHSVISYIFETEIIEKVKKRSTNKMKGEMFLVRIKPLFYFLIGLFILYALMFALSLFGIDL